MTTAQRDTQWAALVTQNAKGELTIDPDRMLVVMASIHQRLDRIDVNALGIPIATATSLGVASFGSGLAINAAGSVTNAGVTALAATVPLQVSAGTGSVTVSFPVQVANRVLAGPGSGADAAPTFRALVAADLPGGTGTVTSVAMTVPSILSVAGSPVTTTGTLAVTLATQVKNKVLAGPVSGADAAPTFRVVDIADVPASVTAPLPGSPGFTIGGEAGNVINVAVQLKDVTTAALAVQMVCQAWLSDAAGGAVTATAPDTSAAIGTNGVIAFERQTRKEWLLVTDASGRFDLNLGHVAGAGTWYLNLDHAGRLYSSGAITFA